MVIKLVQTDSEDPFKITLPVGEHLFGRGKLLSCHDKRISRNHGKLEAYDDHIEIKALHQNPCFYKKNGSEEKHILRKDSIISLNNGDRFGLLPDTFWYEVMHFTLLDKHSEENEKEETNTEDYCIEQSTRENENLNPDETIDVNNRDESSTLISPINENTSDNNSTTLQNQDVDTDCESENEVEKSNHNEEESANRITVKRNHCIDQIDESKRKKTESIEVKTEPVDIKTEPADVNIDPADVKPGPSLNLAADQNNAPSVADPNNVNLPSAANANNAPKAANPNRPLRERCMYGANCYRRNPSHHSQFSHPIDADWGDGPRAPCPYGLTCSHRDPRHHRDHYHPPGHVPPPPQGQRKKRRRNDSPPRLILQGKRQRKLLQVAEQDYSDEEEEDPYGTEESDEWCPESGSQDFSEDYT